MKNPITHYAIILCSTVLMLLSNNQAKASHAMGADLWYQCIDPATNTYQVSLRFYRDCFGVSVPASETVTLASASCGQSITLTLNQLPCPASNNGGIACEVSPLCPAYISQSQCANINNPYPGVQAYTYTATVQIPLACSDWIFSWHECCRNAAITNLATPDSYDLYVEATLNNLVAGSNNSPIFTTLPVPFICANQPYAYSHGAVDADGDSLVYSLVNPLTTGAAQIPYTGSFTPTQPVNTSPPNSLTFGGSTGQLTFDPNGIQVCVITVLVQEYRNGILIGSTMRDIQIVVLNIPGCGVPPIFTGADSSSVQNGFYINSGLVQVCPGSPLSFTALGYNPTGDSVFTTSDVTTSIPGAQVNFAYISSDSIIATILWTPTAFDTGINNLVFTVSNHSCPISSVQAFSITLDVLYGTYAGPDAAYCPAGGPVQLSAIGGSAFSWSPTAGLNNPNIQNPVASPAQTTNYIVTSNLSSSCKNKDTVTVFRVPDFNYTITQSKDTICSSDLVSLNVTADPGFTYTYHWTPATGLSATNIANPVAQPLGTTTYTLSITSDTGCSIKDTTAKIVVNWRPTLQLTADKNPFCLGDTVHLKADISTMPCGLNVLPCNGNFGLKTIGTGAQTAPSPYQGAWEDARMQFLIRASELQAAGMTAGTITDLAFDISSMASTKPYNNFNIKLGCTNHEQLSGYLTGLSLVYSQNTFTPTGTGFSNHNFNSPYDWDGQSNLVIEVCYDNPGNGSSANDNVNGTNTGYNSVLYYFANGTSGCAINSAPSAAQIRPNIQFVYCSVTPPSITYAWSPTTDIFSPDSLNPIAVLSHGATYTFSATDGQCASSDSITLKVDTSFNITAGPDVPFCSGTPAQLSASVTGVAPTAGSFECGVHSTACTTTPVTKTITPAGAVSSSTSIFQGSTATGTKEDERTQILYRASDLLAAGFTKGTINQVGFNITTKASLFPFQNVSIKMGCTDKTALVDSVWEPTTVVYTGLVYTTVVGWNDFALTSSFDWDGTTNIVMEVCWDNPDAFPFGGTDNVLEAGNQSYKSMHSVTAVLSVGCNLGTANSALYSILPAMRAAICAPPLLPVTYIWTPSSGLSDTHVANPTASPTAPTVYTLTAYFGGGCPKVDSVLVTPNSFAFTGSNDTTICLGYSAQLNVVGGNSYTWQPLANLSCSTCSNPVSTPDSTTIYYVQITDTATGCVVNDTMVVTVQSVNANALFTDTLVDQGTAVTIGVSATGGTGNYTYTWTPSDYLNDIHAASPVSTPMSDTLYTVLVSSGPCVDTASVHVRVTIVASPVAIPNAFSPNGDGRNDDFYPVITNGIAKVKTFRVYNRYGQLIHDSTTPWDGKFKNTDQPAGTFIYYIVIGRPNKDDEKFEGAVTLLR